MNEGKGRVCLVGATGRMGRRVQCYIAHHPSLVLSAALQRHGNGTELSPGVPIFTDPRQAASHADVLLDFAAPAACVTLAPVCADTGTAYLVASSGLTAADEAALNAASKTIAVLHAPNLCMGVNVMMELVEMAAARLAAYDVEISEIHHRLKRDAPSGTAHALGEAVQRGRGKMVPVVGRQGFTPMTRANDELGYASLRGGDVAGEHTVYFFGESERLEITHRASSGDIWATGALHAAKWLLGRPPGRYSMHDVLLGDP